ncbi:hypothetical protein KEJ37_00685 [Candidatus Bathyarchaeota archaeon]|nr:hypothetical protein [Candidatus Bathyarchaeota archaeon]
MLEAIIGHLKKLYKDKRGVSNVLVIMLGLILITIAVANVVLWNYQMNQLDWEKAQEKIEITYFSDKSPWFNSNAEYILEMGQCISGTYEDTWHPKDNAYQTFVEESDINNALISASPSEYMILGSTRYIDGSVDDLKDDDNIYLTFGSYSSESLTGIFGNSANGTGYTSVLRNQMYGSLFVSPSAYITAKSISFFGCSSVGTRNVKCMIVRHIDMQIIAITEPLSISTTLQWWTATFSSPPTLEPNTEYVLMIIPNNHIKFYYTDGFANQGHYDTSNNYNSPSNPTDSQHNDYQYCIYCTYEMDLEHRVEIEFRGNVTLASWTQITLAVDSSSTSDTVTAVFQLYDYQAGRYSEVGEDGYASSIIGTNDFLLTKNITSNINRYIDYNGGWRLKVTCVKSTSTSFNFKADLIELKFSIQNDSDFTLSIIGEFTANIRNFLPSSIRFINVSLRVKASDNFEALILKAYNQISRQRDIIAQIDISSAFKYYNVTLPDWQSYIDNNGTLKLIITDSGPDATQTTIYLDFFGVQIIFNGVLVSIRNIGVTTVHIVSIWVINATHHIRYEENRFLNSGETAYYIREDIYWPKGIYMVKVTTGAGNIAVSLIK